MTNDIERHSPDEWRKTAAALMSESIAVGAGETTAKVNANVVQIKAKYASDKRLTML